jgi:hypothetical protein
MPSAISSSRSSHRRTDRACRLERQLGMFRGIRRFDRPSRNYGAIDSASRGGSRADCSFGVVYVLADRGNFPGSVSYDSSQVDRTSRREYDLIELLANRRGRLPQDRPHSIKVDAFKTFDVGKANALTIGSRIRAVSGIPKNALGAHYLYGPNESFLLPRGQLGRTELETSVDLKLSYGRKLGRGMTADVFLDMFNLLNKQGTFDVDKTYAPPVRLAGAGAAGGAENNVNPISGYLRGLDLGEVDRRQRQRDLRPDRPQSQLPADGQPLRTIVGPGGLSPDVLSLEASRPVRRMIS